MTFEVAVTNALVKAELGSFIRVTHDAGVPPSLAARLFMLEEMAVMPGRRRVRVRCLDVTDLLT